MQESKFLIHGRDLRKQMNDCLAYIALTAEDAVAKCLELHPHFSIDYVSIDDTKVETVMVQSLR